jgi:hypothetical protein
MPTHPTRFNFIGRSYRAMALRTADSMSAVPEAEQHEPRHTLISFVAD